MADSKWTKKLVQDHARDAVAIELYTVPFYTTVMTSIKDKKSEAYKILRGILIEEMMHMQLAANLCVALDTTPRMRPPSYTGDIPFLKPGVVINADMEPLNAKTLAEMMAIETPEEILEEDPTPGDNKEPRYPYSSIKEMYDALLNGIEKVGEDQFGWDTTNQQKLWADQGYKQIIRNIGDAREAIEAIKAQGEGGNIDPNLSKPYEPSDFEVPEQYRMDNRAPNGEPHGHYTPIKLREYSHYGRLLKIQQDALHNNGLPEVYTGGNDPNYPLNGELDIKLDAMIAHFSTIWIGLPEGMPAVSPDIFWTAALELMREITDIATKYWKEGITPDWS